MCKINQDNAIEGPRLKTQVRNNKKRKRSKTKSKTTTHVRNTKIVGKIKFSQTLLTKCTKT